ncbi:PIG-L deacetylase family protein [Cupriavidus consociatus]|uniref:PIG-L deacetylase family protein n=1 Tax=Cupriavidus consociatus TaxID=2821357 RepID=UPI001AEB69BE|nr:MULTISPECIES: PIG-L family deacetylase [unclassified Cupriavidus]MBP0623854.1 PIG-L family deacetylase [Cupriavidus sp. LEh25]MDK2660561.1 PIG-L family deacetylase [Cupriavidus sp. LEh21]
MVTDIAAPVTVISPHLDDAVFSCGGLIAAARGARVVTVFAGVPPAGVPAPDWDRAAGFDSAEQAVRARRREDNRALGMLGAQPVWLDFWDGQYGRRHTPREIADSLQHVLVTQTDGMVAAPLGLFHSDHVLAHEACRMLMQAAQVRAAAWAALLVPSRAQAASTAPVQWLYYEDAIYRRLPGVLQQRLAECLRAGLHATPVNLPVSQHLAQKSYAVNAYQSQLQMFGEEQLCDLCAPERYWSLSAGEPAQG